MGKLVFDDGAAAEITLNEATGGRLVEIHFFDVTGDDALLILTRDQGQALLEELAAGIAALPANPPTIIKCGERRRR